MKKSQYLYHYTSIETLELILKNKTIRFNSLDNVDDKEEKFTEDLSDFGKYIFVSCWSPDYEENEELWKLYGRNGEGVRIKMYKYPFKKYYISGENVRKPYWSYNDEVFKDNYSVLLFGCKDPTHSMLKEVKYTEDESLIFPKLTYANEDNINVMINKVGLYKRKQWSNQREWRYSFPILPISKEQLLFGDKEYLISIIRSRKELPIKYYDLCIDDISIKNIEILMGPNTSQLDYEKVINMGKKYNININLEKSCLNYIRE